MSPRLAIDIVDSFVEKFGNIQEIFFIGGEPLLALPTIEAVCRHAERLAKRLVFPKRPKFTVATNGTLITDRVIESVKRHNLRLSISLDGPAKIHDKYRKRSSGKGSHRMVLYGIAQLAKHSLPFALEATYTMDHLKAGLTPLDLYSYLRHKGASLVAISDKMERSVETCWPNSSLQAEYYASVLDLVRYAAREFVNTGRIGLSALSTCIDSIIQRPKFLKDHFCNAGIKVFAVNPVGLVYPCHLFDGFEGFSYGDYRNLKEPRACIPKKGSLASCNACDIRELCRACPGRMLYTSADGRISPNRADCSLKINVLTIALEAVSLALKRVDVPDQKRRE